jgi:hypothetical protein
MDLAQGENGEYVYVLNLLHDCLSQSSKLENRAIGIMMGMAHWRSWVFDRETLYRIVEFVGSELDDPFTLQLTISSLLHNRDAWFQDVDYEDIACALSDITTRLMSISKMESESLMVEWANLLNVLYSGDSGVEISRVDDSIENE